MNKCDIKQIPQNDYFAFFVSLLITFSNIKNDRP